VAEPVVSVAATVILLHTAVTPLQILGGALVLAAAVWGAAARDKRKPPPAEPVTTEGATAVRGR
jgi:drug/metabolite transporter (DMT)-like permease